MKRCCDNCKHISEPLRQADELVYMCEAPLPAPIAALILAVGREMREMLRTAPEGGATCRTWEQAT